MPLATYDEVPIEPGIRTVSPARARTAPLGCTIPFRPKWFSRDAMAGQPPLNFEEQLMTTGAAEGPRDADREDRQRQVGDRARAASGQAGRGPDDRMPDLRATGLAPSNPR